MYLKSNELCIVCGWVGGQGGEWIGAQLDGRIVKIMCIPQTVVNQNVELGTVQMNTIIE